MAAIHQGWRVRWLLIDYSFFHGHHDLIPCIIHPEEGTGSMVKAAGPILTSETTGRAPVAALNACPERRRGTV